MCSIHGWYAWGDSRPDPVTLRAMLLAGAERGGTAPNYSNDATGLAYWRDGQIGIIKDSGKARDFVNNVDAKTWARVADSPRGIMHNRARTKGSICDDSNHPLDAYGWVVVHNGTITNDDDLFAHFKDKRAADVDSVAIPLVLSKGTSYMDSLQQLSVLQGGVTTAMWSIAEPDKIAIGRWGPNELYLWLDDGRKILYWSSAYMSSLAMGYRSMGSLRFQTMTRMPEDRILVLSPEKERTFVLKRRPFLLPLDQLRAYRDSLKPIQLPRPLVTTGTVPSVSGKDTAQESGTSGQRIRPINDGAKWRWEPVQHVKGKPEPVAENVAAMFHARDTIQAELMAKDDVTTMQIPTAYGTWHWSLFIDGQGKKGIFRYFKPARRIKPYWIELYGKVPVFPAVRNGDEPSEYDGKLMLERFFIYSRTQDGALITSPGFMCPTCGIAQTAHTWRYWDFRCRWCDVVHLEPVLGAKK